MNVPWWAWLAAAGVTIAWATAPPPKRSGAPTRQYQGGATGARIWQVESALHPERDPNYKNFEIGDLLLHWTKGGNFYDAKTDTSISVARGMYWKRWGSPLAWPHWDGPFVDRAAAIAAASGGA